MSTGFFCIHITEGAAGDELKKKVFCFQTEFRGNIKKPAIAGFKNKSIFHPQSLPEENAGNNKKVWGQDQIQGAERKIWSLDRDEANSVAVKSFVNTQFLLLSLFLPVPFSVLVC